MTADRKSLCDERGRQALIRRGHRSSASVRG